MIPARELRIGNKVMVYFNDTLHGIVTVESVGNEGINLYHSGGYIVPEYTFDQLQPIPITPEILVQCGFEKESWDDSIYPGRAVYKFYNLPSDAYFIYASGMLCLFSSDGGDASEVIKDIKHFHRFQNIYFELAEKEIEIRENA